MIIYTYTTDSYAEKGWIKIGQTHHVIGLDYTECAKNRIRQQDKTSNPEILKIIWADHFPTISDRDVHEVLKSWGIRPVRSNREWFPCGTEKVCEAINALLHGAPAQHSFSPRPEQEAAASAAANFFLADPEKNKKFLWNAKMRFGKTFTSYLLAEKIEAKKILVLTYKPAAENAWKEDLLNHVRFSGWKFIAKKQENRMEAEAFDLTSTTVTFSSFQLLLQNAGTAFTKRLFDQHWDLVVTDEAHYGSRSQNAETILQQITCRYRLDLSGTPFRMLNDGEYEDDNVFHWSYIDEQTARSKEIEERGVEDARKNGQYFWLPPMHIHTFKPGAATVALSKLYTEDEGFTAAKFFKAEFSAEKTTTFYYEADVKAFLDELCMPRARGLGHNVYYEVSGMSPRRGNDAPSSHQLRHAFWFLPGVNECKAMAALLKKHVFFSSFKIVVAAGDNDGDGSDTLALVKSNICEADRPGTPSRGSITLSCGKLNTGVTVPEWSAVFMLSDTNSPQEYFQTIFRSQSPNRKGGKENCFVFDFNPNRVLSHIYSYAKSLPNEPGASLSSNIKDMLDVMNVFCYDDGELCEIDENDVIDSVLSGGVMRSLLARKFLSDRLINTAALVRLDAMAMSILMKITQEAHIAEKIQTIISESDVPNGKNHAPKDSEIEDEIEKAGKRDKAKTLDMLKNKLKRLCSRLPLFMYLTEDREASIFEVIQVQEPQLFESTTGITQLDFQHLMTLGLLRKDFLDDCVAAFRRFETPSLDIFSPFLRPSPPTPKASEKWRYTPDFTSTPVPHYQSGIAHTHQEILFFPDSSSSLESGSLPTG